MINSYSVPNKFNPGYAATLFTLGSDFTLDLEYRFKPMNDYPSWSFYYKNIRFEEVERDFLSSVTSHMDAFTKDLMDPTKKYTINDHFYMQLVTVDEAPALQCTILYTNLADINAEADYDEEVFLDKAEAHVVAQSLKYALSLTSTLTLRHM